MSHSTQFNSLDFIMQGGVVTMIVALLLAMMSVASWYFIVVKTRQAIKVKKAIEADINTFWSAANIQAAIGTIQQSSPAAQLAKESIEAANHHHAHAARSADSICSFDEFVARSMRRRLMQTSAEFESGLSVLASVGSISPFVGLFGTVWGIYHALAGISASGQATLDKVAGPVGEALIMTAIGLAVAIPAVLAYNAFVKSNRTVMASLESFAQDLHTLLITGAPLMIKNTVDREVTKTIKPSTGNLREVPA